MIEKKKFHNAVYFLEEFKEEHIRIIISRFHGDKMYLERTHDITPEAIHAMTSFCNVGEVPVLCKITKTKVTELTGSVSDQRAMTLNTMKDDLVKYACMVIGYRVFYASRMNYVPTVVVHAFYRMIKENAEYDLCTCIEKQLMENLKSIIEEKTPWFKFSQLLVSLFFYFQGYFLGVGDVQWSNDLPVSKQIKESLQVVGTAYSN